MHGTAFQAWGTVYVKAPNAENPGSAEYLRVGGVVEEGGGEVRGPEGRADHSKGGWEGLSS